MVIGLRPSCPESDRASSSRSSTNRVMESAARLMSCTDCRYSSSFGRPWRQRLAFALMTASGVRSSWEASAVKRRCCSTACRNCSTRSSFSWKPLSRRSSMWLKVPASSPNSSLPAAGRRCDRSCAPMRPAAPAMSPTGRSTRPVRSAAPNAAKSRAIGANASSDRLTPARARFTSVSGYAPWTTPTGGPVCGKGRESTRSGRPSSAALVKTISPRAARAPAALSHGACWLGGASTLPFRSRRSTG